MWRRLETAKEKEQQGKTGGKSAVWCNGIHERSVPRRSGWSAMLNVAEKSSKVRTKSVS